MPLTFASDEITDGASPDNPGAPFGGGRRFLRGADGRCYVVFPSLAGDGSVTVFLAEFDVDADGTASNVVRHRVVKYATTTKPGDLSYSIDLDDNGSTERVVASVNLLGVTTIRTFHWKTDGSAGSNFSEMDSFTHGAASGVPTHLLAHQIIGRNGSGNLHLLYQANVANTVTGSLIKHRELSGPGGTWAAAADVDPAAISGAIEGGSSAEPRTMAAMRDAGGDIHVVYSRRSASSSQQQPSVYHQEWTGSSWSARTTIWTEDVFLNPTYAMPYGLSMAVDLSGDLHVCFAQITQLTPTIGVDIRYFKRSAGTWGSSPEIAVQNPAAFFAGHPSIACDADDSPRILATMSGFGAQTGAAKPVYAQRDSGAWEHHAVQDTSFQWWGSCLPHLIEPHEPSTIGTIHAGMIGSAGFFGDSDLYLLTSNDFELSLSPRPSTAVGVSHVAVASGIINAPASNGVGVSHEAKTDGSERNLSGSNTIGVSHSANVTLVIGIIRKVGVSHAAEATKEGPHDATTAVGVSHVASTSGSVRNLSASTRIGVGHGSKSTGLLTSTGVGVSHAASTSGSELSRPASSAVGVGHAATVVPPEGCSTDFVPSPGIPSDTESVPVVTFHGPFSNPSRSMTMKRPELNDERRLSTNEEHFPTRDGNRRIYLRPGTVMSFVYTFTGLSRVQQRECEDFLEAMRAEEVRYVDHHSHTWKVRFTNREFEFSWGKGHELAQITLQIEGKLIE